MDPRFLKLRTDPRFRPLKRTNKQKEKQATDQRFANVDSNPAFQDKPTPVDKYGRLIPSKEAGEKVSVETDDGVMAMQRMVGNCLSDSDSESSIESVKESDVIAEWGVGAWAVNPDEALSETSPTDRFAVVDMDWSKVTAIDLLAMFRSFTPKSPTSVKRVIVYLSDYGIERLRTEEQQGPSALGVFGGNEGDESSDDGDDEGESVRRYERSKLRYYYAVVECISVDVAKRLVDELDGSEFETSQCILDLRYVRDDEDFESRPVRDAADSIPLEFAPQFFECKALQKTNVPISWDEDDVRRTKIVRRRFTEEELQELDFRAYVGSDSDPDSDEAEQQKAKYATLLQDLDDGCGVHAKDVRNRPRSSDSDSSVPDSGSDDLLQSATISNPHRKVQKDGRRIWNTYEKRRSEKLKRQKRRGQFRVDSSASDSDSGLSSIADEDGAFFEEVDQDKDFIVDLPPPKNNSEEVIPTDAVRKKAETTMELLMLDDTSFHAARQGHEIEDVCDRSEKTGRKKSRRARMKESRTKKKQGKDEAEETDFKVKLDDPRFDKLIKSADFAIDPTDPAFKRTPGADTMLQAVRRKKKPRLGSVTTRDLDMESRL